MMKFVVPLLFITGMLGLLFGVMVLSMMRYGGIF